MIIKSVVLFKTLSNKEISEFEKFLHSPFFNSSKKFIYLFESLKKHKAELDLLNAEIISKEVLKEKYSGEMQTRKLFSDFGKLLDNYLCQREFRNDEAIKDSYLLNEFRRRNIPTLFRREVRQSRNSNMLSNVENYQYYFNKLKIDFEEHSINKFELNEEQLHEIFDEMNADVKNINISLTLKYYITLLLNGIPEKKFRNKIIEILKFINKNKEEFKKCHPKIYIYYLVIEYYSGNLDGKLFNNIVNYLKINENKIGKKDISNAYYIVFHFLVQRVNDGKYDNIQYAFEYFRIINDTGILKDLVEISYITFLNLVNFGLNIQKIDFVTDFVNDFISKVNENYRYETEILSHALIDYENKKTSEAEKELNKINNRNYTYYLYINTLKLKIEYERDEFTVFNRTLDSFRHYLKRKENIPVNQRNSFEMFLFFISKLKIIKRSKYKETCDLEIKLKKSGNFYGRNWIISQLGKLNRF